MKVFCWFLPVLCFTAVWCSVSLSPHASRGSKYWSSLTKLLLSPSTLHFGVACHLEIVKQVKCHSARDVSFWLHGAPQVSPLAMNFITKFRICAYCKRSVKILVFCWPCISVYLFININQLDPLNFIISLFQASTCFENMCSKHVEAWNKLIIKFSATSWLILINKFCQKYVSCGIWCRVLWYIIPQYSLALLWTPTIQTIDCSVTVTTAFAAKTKELTGWEA